MSPAIEGRECLRSWTPQEAQDRQDQEDEEEQLRDPGGRTGDATESENGSEDGDNEKD
jgi:hypothetical protein